MLRKLSVSLWPWQLLLSLPLRYILYSILCAASIEAYSKAKTFASKANEGQQRNLFTLCKPLCSVITRSLCVRVCVRVDGDGNASFHL